MSRTRFALVPLVVLLFSAVLPLSAAGARTAGINDLLSRQFLAELNSERAARGLGPLAWDHSVAGASASWAYQLHLSGRLRHAGSGRAEIIGNGYRTGQITEAWMRSSGHRNLIADSNLTSVGIGVSCDAAGRIWVVAQFVQANPYQASPRSTSASPRVTPAGAGLDCASHDGTERAIRRLYLAYFSRDADPVGLVHWSHLAAVGHPLTWISEQFAVSPEFWARYGSVSDERFVTLAYHNVLGRSPDHGGYQHWLAVLRVAGRGPVMAGFADSVEFRHRSGLH